MKKYVVAAILVVSFAAPAFAEEIYVVFDPASHKCEAMHNIPQGMKSMGKYGSMDEWNKLVSYFDSTDFTRPEVYDEVSSFMDLNSLLNLLSLFHCSQFRSWTWGAFVIKPMDGRWSWTIWDTDRSYNILNWNGFTEYANTSAEKWPNFIPQKLIQIESQLQ